MALDGTYSGLLLSVPDFLNRDDLTAVIPDFITMATTQLTRRLIKDGPVREMLARATATYSSEYTAVPNDFMGARALYLSGDKNALQYAAPEKIVELKSVYSSQCGPPTHYSIVGSELQLWPWAGAGSYQGELTYLQKIPVLSDGSQTNWLLTAHPDAYLYAALLQSAPYLQDDARLEMWGTLATQIIQDIIDAGKVAGSAPQLAVPYVAGGTP